MNPQPEIQRKDAETQRQDQSLLEATVRMWTWKEPAMKRMTLAICRLALERASDFPGEFSANDLPADLVHGGAGICGACFNRLVRDGVLAVVHVAFDQPKTVRNGGGNKIGVYRLQNAALARLALKVHGQPVVELKQVELLIA